MANHIINITGIDANGNLILDDNGRTEAQPGDTVTWNIMPQSGVASITAITDTSNVDVFFPDPRPFPINPPTNPATNWQGTIRSDLSFPPPPNSWINETYQIYYTRKQNGQIFMHDPIIAVKP
ncbi:MAG: hypothetical protein K2Q24_02875 [Chitinophagaceae bacterium]|nr:hypothetical protein [Chitinophagaceae bacterium]